MTDLICRKTGLFQWRVFMAFTLATLLAVPSLATNKSDSAETIIVTATRTEKSITDVANTVSVIDAQQMERQIANNISDLVRYEPGVSVDGGGRFGLSGFAIRGIGGDRVLTLVDSTPTADEFSFGPFLSSRRNFVDLDMLKTVEIVRGPGSSVYGSNAIGGVVNFITKDPIDYLDDDNNFGGSIKLGSSSVDDSFNTTALAAFGGEVWSGMIVGTLRDAAQRETFFDDGALTGRERRSENPQDAQSTNLFAKFVYKPSDAQRLAIVLERFDSETETDALSTAGVVSRGVLISSQRGIDERIRERVSLDYSIDMASVVADTLSVLAYLQTSEADQTTLTERVSPPATVQDRFRRSSYQQENVGFRLQLGKVVDTGSVTHRFSYGVDYDKSDSETLREGNTTNRTDGSPVREFSNFPTRDFPNSQYTSVGVFAQDEIAFMDGKLKIIPSIRYDSFDLEPSAAAGDIFFLGNPGAPQPEGYDESEVSIKLGAIYEFNDSWSAFAQFAEGFRAPPLDSINIGFTNFAGGYTTLPNPDLLPETVESIELGIRKSGEYGHFDFVVYQNDYDNFIESLAVKGFNLQTFLLEFQARNLSQARIQGFELKANYDIGAWLPALKGFKMRAAYAYAEGEETDTNIPINTINPQQLVLGVGYFPDSKKWGVESVLTLVDRKDAKDIDASSLQSDGTPEVLPFEAPGYGVIDVIGHYQLTDKARFNLGIFNLTDKKVTSWSTELVQNPQRANFDRLTQAGRNYSVTFKYDF